MADADAFLSRSADDSTSMKYADKGERIDDLKLILERVTEVHCPFCLVYNIDATLCC